MFIDEMLALCKAEILEVVLQYFGGNGEALFYSAFTLQDNDHRGTPHFDIMIPTTFIASYRHIFVRNALHASDVALNNEHLYISTIMKEAGAHTENYAALSTSLIYRRQPHYRIEANIAVQFRRLLLHEYVRRSTAVTGMTHKLNVNIALIADQS